MSYDARDQSRNIDDYMSMAPEELIAKIKGQKSFHDMDLGAVRTGSWVYPATMPPNYHMLPAFEYLANLDLRGATCLDIGTYDGMTAFVLSELQAGEVHGICQYDLERFRLVRAFKSYRNIFYHPKTDIGLLSQMFEPGSLDLIVISAMMHHLTAPLDALLLARSLLKRGGYLVLESIVTDADEAPVMKLNTASSDPVFGTPTLWVPSLSALDGMLSLACFDVVSQTRLEGGKRARETNYGRVTYLAHAETPDRLPKASTKTRETHTSVRTIGKLNLDDITDGKQEASSVRYLGPVGDKSFNIWIDRANVPLQPNWTDPKPDGESVVKIARASDFRRLVASEPDGAFTVQDISLLATRYPGESMPEGMAWGLKQMGSLFVLDHVKKWGLTNLLEVGPGFNFYFPNHLPEHVEYTGLDASGFYDPEMLILMRKRMPRGRALEGLMGKSEGVIDDNSFDSCVSVSVLEHVPAGDVDAVCRDMYRVLVPGGWALHSIDTVALACKETGARWRKAFADAGFLVGATDDTDLAVGDWMSDPPHAESLPILMRFYGGYKATIWNSTAAKSVVQNAYTLLLAVRKPL